MARTLDTQTLRKKFEQASGHQLVLSWEQDGQFSLGLQGLEKHTLHMVFENDSRSASERKIKASTPDEVLTGFFKKMADKGGVTVIARNMRDGSDYVWSKYKLTPKGDVEKVSRETHAPGR